jgi:hypothetical protein
MSGVQWSAILTGAPDSLPDLDLIVLSMQATLRSSTASFMQVVVPMSQIDDINNRTNGNITIYKTLLPDGSQVELYTVNFNSFRSDLGARSRRLTISGRSESAFPGPAGVTLVGVIADNLQSSGARELMVSPFNDVLPGDTVTYDAVATVIETITITADSSGTTMQLTEA